MTWMEEGLSTCFVPRPAAEDHEAMSFLLGNTFFKVVVGQLRAAIYDHGPITPERIGSAAKRIRSGVRAALRVEGRLADGPDAGTEPLAADPPP